MRLVLSQPLLRGLGPNATFYELRNARRARTGQERRLELTRQQLAVEVAQAFYGVIAARQLVDVARQSLSRTENMLRSSEARLGVGMASKLDVFRADLQTQQARESMVRTEAALANSLERFRGVLALGPGEPVEPEAAALPDVDTSDLEPLEVLVRRALEVRLELIEARDQVDDARRAASLARQNQLPQLDLNVGLNQVGYGGSFGEAWSAADRRVEFYLSASYPFQANQQRANAALAKLELGSRQRGVRQREIEVEQQVRQAMRDLDQIKKSVELQQKAVDVAVQQRRLAVLRYQRGLGSNFEIGEAEAYLVQARSALVALLTQFALARLDLKRTTGTLEVDKEFPR
jgi:outer membrane protein TolC